MSGTLNMNNGSHKLRARNGKGNSALGGGGSSNSSCCGRVTTTTLLVGGLITAICIFIFMVLNSHMVISLEMGDHKATVDFGKFISNRYTTPLGTDLHLRTVGQDPGLAGNERQGQPMVDTFSRQVSV